jgi:hypothetical protein
MLQQIDVYAQERAMHDMKRTEMASGGRWEHPAIRKAGTTPGNDNNGRLGKPIGEDSPIRKGRGFDQPSRIEKSAKKSKKKTNNKKDNTRNKEMMRQATEIGLAVLKTLSAQGLLKRRATRLPLLLQSLQKSKR